MRRGPNARTALVAATLTGAAPAVAETTAPAWTATALG
jgi:hypothetical protein